MKKEDLMLVLKNPELSKLLIDVLSNSDNTAEEIKNPSLEKAVLGETNLFGESIKTIAPTVIDLREGGYQAPSNFVNDYIFPIGHKFVVWYSGHESSLRNAFYRQGIKTSMHTKLKGKKYSITIMGAMPAKRKSA